MTDAPHEEFWLGLDLGGTKMLAIAYDGAFQPLGRERKKTKGHEGPQAGLDRMVAIIHHALAASNLEGRRLTGIGVGCPGPLNLDAGVIVDAPNLGWRNVNIREFLEREFHCPAIIMNDVDAGVYGEYRFGAAQNARCVVGIFPGTGIGGGCVYQGEVLRGKKTSCMEIGHLEVMPDGPLCGCGRRGCLEAVASRLAISGAAAQAAFRGEAPNLRVEAGTDVAKIRSGALAYAVKCGDRAVEQIVRMAARRIGAAAGGVVNLLAPDVIVLGGGLVEALPDLFLQEVETAARERAMPALAQEFQVHVARLGDEAGALGAAAWAQHHLRAHPAAAIAWAARRPAALGVSNGSDVNSTPAGS